MLTSVRLSAPLALLISVQAASVPVQYGPQHCVQLTKSAQSNCVITPHCKGVSLADFDFGFICTDKNGEEVEHVFDGGETQGFEEGVAFDTGIECTKCSAPEPEQVLAAASNETSETTTASANATTAAPTTAEPAASSTAEATGPPETAAFYGPSGCVATYLSPKGSCMVQTRCKPAEIQDYNFGLTCVDKAGASVRHLFGVDSFDPVETFDTLIDCKMCLGLSSDHISDADQLGDQVAQLKTDMKEMKDAVKEIKKELGLGATTTTTTTKKEESSSSGFLHTKSHHKAKKAKKATHHKQHKKAHHERLLEEDDTDDNVENVDDLDLSLEDY